MFAALETSYAVEYKGRLLESLSPLRVVANEGKDCSVVVGVRVRPFSERLDRRPYTHITAQILELGRSRCAVWWYAYPTS